MPGKLRVDYEVSLSELTLAQDLRQLSGEPFGADRRGWYEAYGKVVGPLNAKGLLVLVDKTEVDLKAIGFDLAVEDHPRFTFHFEAEVPPSGRLALNDINYASSEGTSRLALRSASEVEVRGDPLPEDVALIPIRPVWQMNAAEEQRTKRLTVDYAPTARPRIALPPVPTPIAPVRRSGGGLSGLLGASGGAWPGLLLAAIVLGAAHAIQPGHGKTLVAASSLGPGGGPIRGALLGLATASVHLASVALIALAVWVTRTDRFGEVHLVLARLAGFGIAAIGLWRLGRHLGGYGEHEPAEDPGDLDFRGILALGLAGGVVPCWDAVALIVLAQAIGRLALGLTLLAGFSLGMAAVLVAVGLAASRFRSAFDRTERRDLWERRLGILGGLILAGIGISLLR